MAWNCGCCVGVVVVLLRLFLGEHNVIAKLIFLSMTSIQGSIIK